jgi:hypothetical protein
MVARVARFEGVNVQAAQSTMDDAEAIIKPVISMLDGFQSSLDLLSAAGTVLSITIFDTEANAAAAETTFDEQLPGMLGDLFSDWAGKRVSVEHYEVLAQSDT